MPSVNPSVVSGTSAGVNVNTPEVSSYANAPSPLAVAVVTLKSVSAILVLRSAGAKVNTPVPLSYANEPPALAPAVVVLNAAWALASV